MKTIYLSLIVSFLSLNSLGQENQDTLGDFVSSNGSVYWSHKYEKKLSFTTLLNSIKRANILIGIDTFNNTIIGQSIESFIDYRGAGYTAMTAPTFLSSGSYKSSVLIENYDGYYTVTINKIFFINQNDTKLISPTLGSAQGESTPLETYAIKKTGKFRSMFIKPASKIIEYNFLKFYDF